MLDRDVMEAGTEAPVQIQLEKPAAAAVGDRFIIRRYSPAYTIGGGEIIEIDALKPKKNRKIIAQRVIDQTGLDLPDRIAFYIRNSGLSPVSTAGLARQFCHFPDQVGKWLKQQESGVRKISGENTDLWIGEKQFNDYCDLIIQILRDYHKGNPSSPGMKRLQLVQLSGPNVNEIVRKATLDRLISDNKISVSKDIIKSAGFSPSISDASIHIKDKLLNCIRKHGVSAPSINEAVSFTGTNEKELNRIIDVLVDEGTIVVVEKTFLYLTDEIERIKEALKNLNETNNNITLGEFRTALNTSRKYALPLLNYFDEIGFTVRIGDERVLK
jgi:selenocysteine-specific elongation factor